MKLSTAISTPDAKFSAFALKMPLEDSFAFAARHGLDGVELHLRDTAGYKAFDIRHLMKEHGLAVVALGTGRAFGEDGLCFSSPDASVRDAAVARVRGHIDLAAELGADVIIGLILGKEPRTPESLALATDCMRRAAEHALGLGVDMLVEPINRYETSFIITADDCLAFLAEIGLPNCKVLLDTFHMNIEEKDIVQTIKRAGAKIGHVHIADSNRRYPGSGHIDFRAIVAALRDTGYSRYLSAEMLPDPDPETSMPAMVGYMRSIIYDVCGDK